MLDGKPRPLVLCFLTVGLSLALAGSASSLVLGQSDDFEDGSVQGWAEGGSPNPPVNVASGGPLGAGDGYLQDLSSGSAGSGGAMVAFNRLQWAGNWLGAGASAIRVDLANLGGSDMTIRIALGSSFGQAGTWYASTDEAAFALPADGVWRTTTFRVDGAHLTKVAGSAALNTVLSGVAEFRILSSEAPHYQGDRIAATLGIDNLTAVPEPGTGLLLATGLAGLCRLPRRRQRT